MSEHPDVVLLRSGEEAPDPYVTAFERAGLHAVCEPVLAFAFPNQERLRAHLERRDCYEALIATSPRVAIALERLFANREDLARTWRGTTAYAVGPKTAKRLREVGLEPRGAEAGDAAALARQIVADAPGADLLFLCGNRRRDTLPDRLRGAGVLFEELVVYETHPRQDLTLPPSRQPSGTTWLAFFSPSGLEAVEQAESGNLREYRIAAIGSTTGGALADAGHSVEAVADAPSPDGLVSAIQAAETES
jgi:uroporphyrinogen-III synthase